VHLDIIEAFYLPTDAQENCFKIALKQFSCASVGNLKKNFDI